MQAASHLGISDVTLQIHRGQIMRKMRGRFFAELVKMGQALGVGSPALAGVIIAIIVCHSAATWPRLPGRVYLERRGTLLTGGALSSHLGPRTVSGLLYTDTRRALEIPPSTRSTGTHSDGPLSPTNPQRPPDEDQRTIGDIMNEADPPRSQTQVLVNNFYIILVSTAFLVAIVWGSSS
jgi:hypothetical protein